MDFAAQLANLQQSAEVARRRPADQNARSDGDRPRQRQRQEESSSSSSPSMKSLAGAPTTTATASKHSSPRNNKPIPFHSLQRVGYRIDPIVLPPVSVPDHVNPQQHQRVRHICLLAVIIDDLPYEDLWKQWANTSIDKNRNSTKKNDQDENGNTIVSLVCHAKFPHKIQSEFVKQHLLQQPPQVGRGTQLAPPEFRSHQPEWGSIEILRAMLDMLHDGLQIGLEPSITDDRYHPKRYLMTSGRSGITGTPTLDSNSSDSVKKPINILPPADMFVFISETCIPIQPLAHWILHLDANRSWVNARHRTMPGTPRNKYELDQFEKMRLVPGDYRWKADQWLALCRPHAISIREIDNHLPERDRLWRRGFQFVNASDEMYFPTALAILQLLKPNNEQERQQQASSSASSCTSDAVEKRPVTYTDWSQGMKNPASFTKKDLRAVVDKARAQGCLIARKFIGEIGLTDWAPLCNTAKPEAQN